MSCRVEKIIYKICTRHEIDELLLKLALNNNQYSISFYSTGIYSLEGAFASKHNAGGLDVYECFVI